IGSGNVSQFGGDYDYEAAAIRANPPPFVGTFHPDSLDQSSVGGRFQSAISVGMYRSLQFHAVPARNPGFVKMWNLHYGTGKSTYQTESTSGTDPSQGMSARFVEKAGGKVYSYIDSTFLYRQIVNAGELLIEKASGGEAGTDAYNWSAAVS